MLIERSFYKNGSRKTYIKSIIMQVWCFYLDRVVSNESMLRVDHVHQLSYDLYCVFFKTSISSNRSCDSQFSKKAAIGAPNNFYKFAFYYTSNSPVIPDGFIIIYTHYFRIIFVLLKVSIISIILPSSVFSIVSEFTTVWLFPIYPLGQSQYFTVEVR